MINIPVLHQGRSGHVFTRIDGCEATIFIVRIKGHPNKKIEKNWNSKLSLTFKINLQPILNIDSRVAQRKRAGPITQRSVDRNYALLTNNFWKYTEATEDSSIWKKRSYQ